MKLDPVIRPGKCGSHSGWNAHQRGGERSCLDCTAFRNRYAAERRAAGGPLIEQEAMLNRARSRAAWRLKDMHRDTFDLLVEDEMRAERASLRTGEDS